MADRDSSRARRDVVVVGASAGGPKALRAMAASLPPDLPATVVVVLHVPAYGRSVLPDILSRSGPLPARHVMAPTRLALGSMRSAVIVLDRQLTIRTWNKNAQELWGVRSDEAVGVHLLTLDIGLPINELKPLLHAVLSDDSEPQHISLDAINRRGRPVRLSITAAPLMSPDEKATGILLVMDAEPID